MTDQESMRDKESPSVWMEHFGERLRQLYTFYIFEFEFDRDEDLETNPTVQARGLRLQTIRNACLNASLLALRDLDDFFSGPAKPAKGNRRRQDDLRAADFGYQPGARFLSEEERDHINWIIAHSTKFGSAAAEGKKWDLNELFFRAMAQSIAFLKWVEAQPSTKDDFMLGAMVGLTLRTAEKFQEDVEVFQKAKSLRHLDL